MPETFDYIIEPSNKTAYYFKDGKRIEIQTYNITMKNESVIQTLPSEITPGSWAFTVAAKKVWQKDFDGSWVPVE